MVGLRCAIVDLPERSVDPVLLTHLRRQADKCLWLRLSYIVEFVLPPTLAACPAARCVIEACRQPWRVYVNRDGHGSRASFPASGARPANGRPSCCQFRVVCTYPVSRPGRAAHSPHEARPEPIRLPTQPSRRRVAAHGSGALCGHPATALAIPCECHLVAGFLVLHDALSAHTRHRRREVPGRLAGMVPHSLDDLEREIHVTAGQADRAARLVHVGFERPVSRTQYSANAGSSSSGGARSQKLLTVPFTTSSKR